MLIVVVILGILAAIALPAFFDSGTAARQVSFQSSLRQLVQASQMYLDRNGELPTQAEGDPFPPAILEQTFGKQPFPDRTPLGGFWRIDRYAESKQYSVSVWIPSTDPDEAAAVEAQLNDAVVDLNLSIDETVGVEPELTLTSGTTKVLSVFK